MRLAFGAIALFLEGATAWAQKPPNHVNTPMEKVCGAELKGLRNQVSLFLRWEQLGRYF